MKKIYKNYLRFQLLQREIICGCKANFSMDKNERKIFKSELKLVKKILEEIEKL